MKELSVRITLTDELLGTAAGNPWVHDEFIASKAPGALSRKQEIEALGPDAVIEKAKTVFPKTADGAPFIWDYNIKGFFKDAASMLRRVPGSKTSKLAAYRREIDGLVFIKERRIPITLPAGSSGLGSCQRPLRAQTPQGERVSLADSESAPEGSCLEFTVQCLVDGDVEYIEEWLDYGAVRGLGRWRNSGKGRFVWQEAPGGDRQGKGEAEQGDA